jgi:hypothetical protein
MKKYPVDPDHHLFPLLDPESTHLVDLEAELEERARSRRMEAEVRAEVRRHYRALTGGAPSREGADVEARLASLATFHRGALALRYVRRKGWPPALRARFGGWTSLVVRLACAPRGSDVQEDVATLEAAAAEALRAAIAAGRDARAHRSILARAKAHVREALRAYSRTAEDSRSVPDTLPEARDGPPTLREAGLDATRKEVNAMPSATS